MLRGASPPPVPKSSRYQQETSTRVQTTRAESVSLTFVVRSGISRRGHLQKEEAHHGEESKEGEEDKKDEEEEVRLWLGRRRFRPGNSSSTL